MTLPRKLKNFVLFNDGVSYAGEVPEVQLPKLSRKMEDYRAGGMNGPIKLDFGMEALEMEWTAAGYLRSLLTQWAELRHDAVLLRFAGALQADDVADAIPLEVVVRGRHSEIDFGKHKAGDATEIKVKSVLSYYKLTYDGEVLHEIDLMNMVEIIAGVDRLARVRTALGIA
ncbi:phage major tail tube protein [uncultured Xylophilus sp.]|uniref:phage major tail tube protein n=1 Tax=uncultured Xylophilus sp. TaxID=296832 RepID=UPI0025DE1C74|nr:phage major tail tube protein [uncultured Xylophilus sp.]